MSTTTIRLPEELKSRVARAAERSGTTAHGFILQAIAEKTEALERQSAFRADTERRYTEIVASGQTLPWAEVRDYLERQVAAKSAIRPAARKLAR